MLGVLNMRIFERGGNTQYSLSGFSSLRAKVTCYFMGSFSVCEWIMELRVFPLSK